MSLLKDILGTHLYEAQKKVAKSLLDGLSSNAEALIKERKEEIYILQKEVIADIQIKVEDRIKEEANEKIEKALDLLIEKAKGIRFIGGIVSSLLAGKKQEILNIVRF